MPRMPLSGVRISCEIICQEPGFGAVCGFRLVTGIGQCALRLDTVRDVASDALHLRMLAGANHDFAPGDPPGAVLGGDLLVIAASPVGKEHRLALLDDSQGKRAAHKLSPLVSAELAEGIACIGDEV